MRRQHAAVGWFAGLLLRVEHDGAGTIAEQHAGSPVVPVEDPRKRLGADHQPALERAGAEKIISGGEREHKSRANRLQVEGRSMMDGEGASTIRSIDCASIPASARAARAAWTAKCEVNSPSAAMWRCLIPVRCTIHSSEVSIRTARLALVRICRGR